MSGLRCCPLADLLKALIGLGRSYTFDRCEGFILLAESLTTEAVVWHRN